ncbi:hypothetical protein [Lacticaseibacillus suihuaensis]
MIKWLRITGLTVLVLALAGCQRGQDAQTVRRNSAKILNRAETLWVEDATVTAALKGDQLTQVRVTQTTASPNVVTTRRGLLGAGTTKISYATAKRLMTATAKQQHQTMRLASLAALNRALTEAKAKFKLTGYNQLTTYKTTGTQTALGIGYVAAGDTLYALSLGYDPAITDLPVATVYVSGQLKVPKTHLSNRQLAGRWVSEDKTQQLRVTGDQLYHVQVTGTYTSVERFTIQDLRRQGVNTTYTGTFQAAQLAAAVLHYGMPKTTTRAASDGQATYLFLTENTMVKLSQGQVTPFTKTAKGHDTSRVPAEFAAVFAACDRQEGVNRALAVSPIAAHQYEITYNDPNRLTNVYNRSLNRYRFATVEGGRATLRDRQ